MKLIKAKIKIFAAMLFCGALSLAGWRVDELSVARSDGEILYKLPAANGYRFTTGYLHSVELTPVEDEYIVAEGAIWNWQERVKSSNAGMPSIAPKRGRYINRDGWLIFQGGGIAQRRFYLRVGDENFGRNWIEMPPYGRGNLYENLARERLTLSVEKRPLAMIKVIRPQSLDDKQRFK